jgi:mRNA-degrading endonuclease RelE of RelBE toxin-antitoxin system
VTYHVEIEPPAWEAYDKLGVEQHGLVAIALVLLARYGRPDQAVPAGGNNWRLRAGDHDIYFLVDDEESDVYVQSIMPALGWEGTE